MFSGDEFYDDELTSGIDVLAAADFRRDQLKHTSSCSKCGAREPVRIEAEGCDECADFPRCGLCRRWVGDGSGWLPGYVNALSPEGGEMKVCDVCWKDEPE